MSTLRHVHLHDVPPQPWRNGGGVTRELLAWPAAGHWRLRVSVATIERSGPFSPFPEVRRWFAVIAGAGVRLALPRGAVTTTPASDVVAFDGEAAPECQLLEGPTRDLNFMVRRDAGAARMWRAHAGDGIAGPTRWRGLYAAAVAQLLVDGNAEAVAAGTLVWSDRHDAVAWELPPSSAGPLWLMLLED